jgi:hypothetical protein
LRLDRRQDVSEPFGLGYLPVERVEGGDPELGACFLRRAEVDPAEELACERGRVVLGGLRRGLKVGDLAVEGDLQFLDYAALQVERGGE